ACGPAIEGYPIGGVGQQSALMDVLASLVHDRQPALGRSLDDHPLLRQREEGWAAQDRALSSPLFRLIHCRAYRVRATPIEIADLYAQLFCRLAFRRSEHVPHEAREWRDWRVPESILGRSRSPFR